MVWPNDLAVIYPYPAYFPMWLVAGAGLVILAISDEDTAKVEPFIAEHKYTYPILLDPGRKVNTLFEVQGIPKSFVYNREGKLVAVGIDRRTERQFLEMLKMAGVQ
jgi:peroxiredoxin